MAWGLEEGGDGLARDVRADLIADLTYLRKGAGLTISRLAQAGAVVAHCGGPGQPLETVHERLLAALRSIEDSEAGRALAAAYGLDRPADARGELGERRQAHAEAVGRTAYTVRDWEDRAIEELALRLLSSFYAGAPTPGDLAIPHGGLLLQELVTTYLIQDRVFVESQQARTIISLVDGAAGFIYGSYTPTELFGVTGGTVSTRHVRDGTLHEIRFPKRLRRAEQHRFSFQERVTDAEESQGDEPKPEDFAGQTFESPTLRFRVEVCFLGERPETVWTYDKLSRIERPGEPTSERRIELPGNVVVADFADLYGGLCSGIAWRW